MKKIITLSSLIRVSFIKKSKYKLFYFLLNSYQIVISAFNQCLLKR